ncbi:MAG: hypothetical protein AAFY08_15910 [Planctomycetota bacterium]
MAGVVGASESFTDRARWTAATKQSVDFTVDFEDFTDDTPVLERNAPVDAGPFEITEESDIFFPASGVTRIETAPYPTRSRTLITVNGTNFMDTFVGESTNTRITLAMDAPIKRFGASFLNPGDEGDTLSPLQMTLMTESLEVVDVLTLPVLEGVTFFGFTSDTPVTSIVFSQEESSFFGIDDILGGYTIPEPSSLVFLAPSLWFIASRRQFAHR